MAPTIAVIINAGGGRAGPDGAALAGRVRRAFAAQGWRIEPQIVAGEDLAAALDRAGAAEMVAVGGGDGTLGTAAGKLAERGQRMAILPLGTRNHFARDLGIPTDLDKAAEVAVKGRPARIDLAAVNDTVFANNASIGLYARLVRSREAHPLPKLLATIPAAWTVLRGLHTRRIMIAIDGHARTIETPLLFVGNNRYAYEGAEAGARARLDQGLLSVYAVRPRSAAGLLWLALRALLGRADPARDFAAIADAAKLQVEGAGPIAVAHDGEVSWLTLPLAFRSLPGALEVMVPSQEAG